MNRGRVALHWFVFALLVCTAARICAEDWPEFRGPTGQGHSAERGLPLDWSESRHIIWKSEVPGTGWSSPVVRDGRVWMTTAVNTREIRLKPDPAPSQASLRVLAFNVDTGRLLVNTEVAKTSRRDPINPKNSDASPTPIVDSDRVYVHYGADGTAALTAAGEVVWKTKLGYESQHGNGGSPVLYGDLLIVSCDGSDSAYVVALDKRTGKVRWRTWRRQPWDQAYSTPLVIRVGDRDELVSVGAYRAAAYDPASGKEIWRVSYADGFSNVPRPVYGHGLVYIATGFQEPTLIAVRADGAGDVTKTHIAWTLRRGAPLTPSPLLVGDELYVVSDGGIASCLDAVTGEARWIQRLGGGYSASPIFADGRIYFLSEEGVATIIAPGREFKVLAINRLNGDALGSMAVAAGSIFIRTDSFLYRIG